MRDLPTWSIILFNCFCYIPKNSPFCKLILCFFVRYFQKGLREICSLTRRLVKSVFGKPNTFLAITTKHTFPICYIRTFANRFAGCFEKLSLIPFTINLFLFQFDSEGFKYPATYFLFSQKFDFKQSCGYLIKMYSQFSVVKRIFSF